MRIDAASALLACGGMVGLVYGLGEATSDGWGSTVVIASLAAAVVLLVAFVVRQARTAHPLLPLRIVSDRNRGGALIALVFNALSTFGMMLILTYQLQGVMSYSPLVTGLALLPFALAAAFAAALVAPRAMARISARWLIVAGILLSASGLVPLIWLSPTSHYLPLIFAATVIEGFGTGLAAPPALSTALKAVLPSDTGSASAVSSAASQLGSSVGAALLNTIAVAATASYLVAHAGKGVVSATVHGFTVAIIWGVVILVISAIPVSVLIDEDSPAR